MPEPAVQSLRDGRYAITRMLGEGAQAATLEAVDKRDGRLVAIKRFRVKGASSWKEVELAEREARVLAQLSHPLIPRYIEHFEENGELFLVTEKIEGQSLLALRKSGFFFSEAEALRFLRHVSEALDYLHARVPPVIHRDIKPSNVMRRSDGKYVLIDFGSVRDRLKPEGGSTVVGTFGYMAPEQFQGRAMAASDVYSVGATVLSMMAGKEPEDLPHKGLSIDVNAVVGTSVSPALRGALSAMLEPDPDKRSSSIKPLLADLTSSQAHPRPSSPPWGPPPPPPPPHPPHPPHPPWAPGGPPFFGWDERQGGRQSKKARREARKAQRRAAREQFRQSAQAWEEQVRAQPPGRRGPALLLIFISIVLTFAQVGITIVLRGILPILFTLLAVVFGKGMREAARSVNEAGKRSAEMVGKARDALWARVEEATNAQPSQAETERGGPRVRVEDERPAARPVNASSMRDQEVEAEQAQREADEALELEEKQRQKAKRPRS